MAYNYFGTVNELMLLDFFWNLYSTKSMIDLVFSFAILCNTKTTSFLIKNTRQTAVINILNLHIIID